MEPTIIAKQTIEFQKKLFENSFTAMEMVQNQTEKMIDLFLKQPWVNEEGKKAVNESIDFYKKARTDFKQAVDDGFKKVEEMFAQK